MKKVIYKITGENSDIISPVKVLDNVSLLWVFNDSPIIEHKGYVLQILPEEQGTLKHIPGATLPVVLLDNMRESLVYTRGVLHALLNHWCHE